jgi:hypothetical protein
LRWTTSEWQILLKEKTVQKEMRHHKKPEHTKNAQNYGSLNTYSLL